MKQITPEEISIRLNIKGADRYEKVSFPIRYGVYSEIQTDEYTFQFNLNGEIKTISGRNTFQIEPTEWIKRTQANDWVFYSSGGYNGAVRTVGEHYVPCFTYQSNAITGGNPFKTGFLEVALSALFSLVETLSEIELETVEKDVELFIRSVVVNNSDCLQQRAVILHKIVNGSVPVLPPDTRHVDYDVIPVNVAEGCLYNCKFCRVKNGTGFKTKGINEISEQIDRLRQFYSRDLTNYNSIFLGQNDALNAGVDIIEYAALEVFNKFGLKQSNIKNPCLFLFGSADSFLNSTGEAFRRINNLPYETFINIGFESFDKKTLSLLGKPVTAEKMKRAFQKMIRVNKQYNNIEISGNILIGGGLSESHYTSFFDEVQNIPPGHFGKGTIYISPFENGGERREILKRFKQMKNQSPIPAFLYLIQRL